MNLLKGKKPLTPDLVDTVAQATGLAASEVAQAVLPLPQGLVIEMDHPRWRPTWRAVAESDGVDEATARMTVSYGTFAHAARQTGTGAPDWRGRLKQFLRSKDPQYKHQDR